MKLSRWITSLPRPPSLRRCLPACDMSSICNEHPAGHHHRQPKSSSRMGEPRLRVHHDNGRQRRSGNTVGNRSGVHCYMIAFDRDQDVVTRQWIRCSTTPTTPACADGLSPRTMKSGVFSARPRPKVVFDNLRGGNLGVAHRRYVPSTEETYFMVHFDTEATAPSKRPRKPRGNERLNKSKALGSLEAAAGKLPPLPRSAATLFMLRGSGARLGNDQRRSQTLISGLWRRSFLRRQTRRNSSFAEVIHEVQSDRTAELSALLQQRLLVLDGAMGTMIQRHGLQEADYRGDAVCRSSARPQGQQ